MRRSPSGKNRLAAEASGERWRNDKVLAVRAPLPEKLTEHGRYSGETWQPPP